MRMILATGVLTAVTVLGHTNPSAAETRDFIAELRQTGEYVGEDATGQARFHVSADGSELRYELTADRLENFTQAHIHITPNALIQQSQFERIPTPSGKNENGPIVVFLTDFMRGGVAVDGILTKGVITAADLVGPLNGYSLRLLVEIMARGDSYVALHVLKPIPPANTFCCPVGLRGFIKAARAQ